MIRKRRRQGRAESLNIGLHRVAERRIRIGDKECMNDTRAGPWKAKPFGTKRPGKTTSGSATLIARGKFIITHSFSSAKSTLVNDPREAPGSGGILPRRPCPVQPRPIDHAFVTCPSRTEPGPGLPTKGASWFGTGTVSSEIVAPRSPSTCVQT